MKTAFLLLSGILSMQLAAAPLLSSANGQMRFAAHSISKLPRFGISLNHTNWVTAVPDSSILISSYYDKGGSRPTDDRLYRYDPADHELTTIIEFGGEKGKRPTGKLVQGKSPSLFYGITFNGGKSDDGTLYSIDMATGLHTVIHHFDHNGPRHPIYGLIWLSDHELLGLCDTTNDPYLPEPNMRMRTAESMYIYDIKTNRVQHFSPRPGKVAGLPTMLNSGTLVLLYEENEEHVVVEYSVKNKKVVTETEVNFPLWPISNLEKGKDSCVYVMNYQVDANSSTYPFFCYDAKTKKCNRVSRGSSYTTLYSGEFVIDKTGTLYGWFKMGPGTMPHGLMFRYTPGADSVEAFMEWPHKTDAVNDENNEQLTPGYDFTSNPVIGADGKLYAMTWDSGLCSFDLATKKVQRLAKY